MGYQGQLSSVNLTDIFQTLHMNRQTGTLSVSSPDGVLHLYFDAGQVAIASAPPVDNKAFLVYALLHKGMISPETATDVNHRLYATGQTLRDLLLGGGVIGEAELDEVSAWCIEELACPIFEWSEGDFSFTDGAPTPQLLGPDIVAMGRVGLQTTQLMLEATRRKDEWKRIREVITEPNDFYVVDNEGRNNLRNVQTDPEMLKVLRFLDGRHTLDQVASTVGVTRFDTFAIAAQLVLGGVARLRIPEEVVADAESLRADGDLEQAKTLLETVFKKSAVPEVMRPLAEIYTQLKQAPRAVELYLELIQVAQDQGDLDQARKDLDTVLALSPDDPDLQFDRAKVLSELGVADEAAMAYVAAAQAYIATRDTGRAIDACHRAKNLLPRSPDPHRFLAKAYLMDGQSENAVVEYKSLWHALLTAERPRKAIEMLRQVLESDCRFNNIKEQVLSHAQNSEAIKTSKSIRVLVNVVIFLVIVGAGFAGYRWWQTVIREGQAREALEQIKAAAPEQERAGTYATIFSQIKTLRSEYANHPKVITDADAFQQQMQANYEARAGEQIKTARAYLAAGQHDKAGAALAEIKARFPGTQAEEQANALLAQVTEDQVSNQVNAALDEARRLWTALEWDAAIAHLQPILQRGGLTPKLHSEINAQANDWNGKTETAKDLFERAEKLEQAGRKKEALDAYLRASKGKGELFAEKGRNRLASLEGEFAQETGQTAVRALERGDDKLAFAALDDLSAQMKRATGKGVADLIAKLQLPFTVRLDSHLASLTIKRAGVEQLVRAPTGTKGAWNHRIVYLPTETLTVEARRPGFTGQAFPISYQARRSGVTIALARGPLWQTDLSGAAAVTTPVAVGKFVLVGSNKATIEVVDTTLGTSKPISFPPTVDEFRQPPQLYQGQVLAIIDNRLSAVDFTTRSELWSYPSRSAEANTRLSGQVWGLDHELIPGQQLYFIGAAKGQLLSFARDQNGRSLPYPKVDLGGELTGALVGDQPEPGRTVLYAPVGNQLLAFETAAATERTPATLISTFRTRGEIQGRVVRAVVAGKPAILILDSAGLLIAIDADPAAPDNKRALGSWGLDGTGVVQAAVGPNAAYVAVTEGRVVAIDLAHPGQLLWRFPAQGAIGQLSGAPVIGQRGIYVADQKGTLYCLDLTGRERWKTDLGSPVMTGILVADGRIYVPTRNGPLMCFEEGEE